MGSDATCATCDPQPRTIPRLEGSDATCATCDPEPRTTGPASLPGLLIALLLGACGGGHKVATTPAQPAITCASVADAMVGAMVATKEPRPGDAVITSFTILIRTRCDEDHWTVEARQCLATMTTRAEAERCSTLMTESQQANLVRDQQAKFGEPEPPPAAPEAARAAEPAAAMRDQPAPAGAVPASDKEAAPADKARTKAKRRQKTSDPARPPLKDVAPGRTGDPCDGGE